MSKLSGKIRIVDSGGEVVEGAGKDSDKLTNKGSDVQEKESIVDKIKGMIGKKDKDEDYGDSSLDEVSKRPRKRQGSSNYPNYQSGNVTGGQVVDGDPFKDLEEDGGKKKTETPILIGIIIALAIVGIAAFIYAFNSSTMASFEVEPQQIEEPAVEQVLEGEHENFTSLVEGISEVEEVEASDVETNEDTEIQVETPQEKERLEDQITYLGEIIQDLEGENKKLRKANEELRNSTPDNTEEVDAQQEPEAGDGE